MIWRHLATLGWRHLATPWRHFGDTWRHLGDAWRRLATLGYISATLGPFGDARRRAEALWRHFGDTLATLGDALATLGDTLATPVASFQLRRFGRRMIFRSIDCGRRLVVAALIATDSVWRFRAALASRYVCRHPRIRRCNAIRSTRSKLCGGSGQRPQQARRAGKAYGPCKPRLQKANRFCKCAVPV